MIKYYNSFLTLLGINNYSNKYFKGLTYLHYIFIMSCYSPIFYSLYLLFHHKNHIHLINVIPHIRDIFCLICLYSDKSLKNYIYDFIVTHTKNKKFKSIYIFFYIFSFTVALTFSLLKFYNYNFYVVDVLGNNSTNLEIRSSLVFFQTFYSLLLNLFIIFHFIIIFKQHYENIELYNKQLYNENYKLYVISQQIIDIKYNYNISINKLNKIFSASVSCGFITIFFFIKNLESDYTRNDINSYLNVIIFTILLLSFHVILNKNDDKIKDLKQYTANSKYMRLFLDRKNDNYKIDIDNYNLKEISLKNFILDLENGNSIDWYIFNKILNEEWGSFEIFGFDWDNGNIIIKLVSLIVILVIGFDIF